jgi:hypothetical protein
VLYLGGQEDRGDREDGGDREEREDGGDREDREDGEDKEDRMTGRMGEKESYGSLIMAAESVLQKFSCFSALNGSVGIDRNDADKD